MGYNAFISYSHAADGKLAPALQNRLEKYAKPWYKLRHLNIFRDESSLSSTPHLWKNITTALDASEYLIYMASPNSAKSIWVNRELQYWLENKSVEQLIICLTDGDLIWDNESRKFLSTENNAMAPALEQVFEREPFHIDMREFKSRDDLNEKNPVFDSKILLLAAQLHGREPKNMAGAAVRAHRKMIWIRNAAIFMLVLLLGVSIFKTAEAQQKTAMAKESEAKAQCNARLAEKAQEKAELEAKRAEDSSVVAVAQRILADSSARVAIIQRDYALLQEDLAKKQRNKAQANFLIAEAQLAPTPTRALITAQEALKFSQSDGIKKKISQIYQEGLFFKSLLLNANIAEQKIAFLPDNKGFVTLGTIKDLKETYDVPVDPIVFTHEGKSIVAKGTKYRKWNLQGKLLHEVKDQDSTGVYDSYLKQAWDTPYRLYEESSEQGNTILIVRDTIGKIVKDLHLEEKIPDLQVPKVSPSGATAFALCNNGDLLVWDLTSGFKSRLQTGISAYSIMDTNLALSDDEKLLALSTREEIQLWDLSKKIVLESRKVSKKVDSVQFVSNSRAEIYTPDATLVWDLDIKLPSRQGKVPNTLKIGTVNKNLGYQIFGMSETLIVKRTKIPDSIDIRVSSRFGINMFKVSPSEKYIVATWADTLGVYINRPLKDPNSQANTLFKVNFSKTNGEYYASNFTFNPEESGGVLEFKSTIDFNSDQIKKTFVYVDFNSKDLSMSFPVVSSSNQFVPYEMRGSPAVAFSPSGNHIILQYDNMLTLWETPSNLMEFIKSDWLHSLENEQRGRVKFRIFD